MSESVASFAISYVRKEVIKLCGCLIRMQIRSTVIRACAEEKLFHFVSLCVGWVTETS